MDTKYTLEDITSTRQPYFPIWKVVEHPGLALVEMNIGVAMKKAPIELGRLMGSLQQNEITGVVYNVVGPDDSFFTKVLLACGLHKGTNHNLANLSTRYGFNYSFVGLSWDRAQNTEFMLTDALFQKGKAIRDHSYLTIDDAIDGLIKG